MNNVLPNYPKTGESFVKSSFLANKSEPLPLAPQVLSTFDNHSQQMYQHISPYPNDTDIAEIYSGAKLLNLGVFKQGEQIAGVLNATNNGLPLYDTVVIEMSRRSAKTTSIFELLLGRCQNRPGYKVVFTAQDGTRARAKFRNDVLMPLQAMDFEGISDPNSRLGELYFGAGTERIEFDNGSKMWVVTPDPGAFRGDAADVIFIDEAGELSPDKATALLAGALPLMDTRPHSQVIIAGTPNTNHRAGLLWTYLQDFEAGEPGVGGVVYAAPDTAVFADLSDPDNPVYDVQLLEAVHPGIQCGLTTAAKVMKRIGPMGLERWQAEYLCQWPHSAAMSALDVDAWTAAAVDFVARPDRIAIAWDVEPDGSFAALVAAWRVDDVAHFEVLAAQGGSDWLPSKVKQAFTKYRTAIGYDAIGQNVDIANRLERPPYRVNQKPLTMKQMIGAAARIDKAIRNKTVVHFDQPVLNDAIESAAWRPAGKDGRLFSRKLAASPVAPIVAASEALWIYDNMPVNRSKVKVLTA